MTDPGVPAPFVQKPTVRRPFCRRPGKATSARRAESVASPEILRKIVAYMSQWAQDSLQSRCILRNETGADLGGSTLRIFVSTSKTESQGDAMKRDVTSPEAYLQAIPAG